MANKNCDLCRNPKEASTMTPIETTEDERAVMKKMGEAKPREKYLYCQACVRLLSDPEKAQNFMRGLMEFHARATGHEENTASRVATDFADKLKEQKK